MIFSLFPIGASSYELLVVQTVTTTKRNFVVRKGIKDGVAQGQVSMFSTKNLALLAKATLVQHEFSMWTPVDKNLQVPFMREDFIIYNSSPEGIDTILKKAY